MDVKFYSFAKRHNSTKQPTGGTTYTCILKDRCSDIAPVIQLDLGLAFSPAAWNYCFIDLFGRFYYVSEWVFNERLWEAHCIVDPMASWKSYIGSYTGYIARSSAAYNSDATDLYYPILADVTDVAVATAQDPGFVTNWSSGQFVVGIMGSNAGPNGGAVTYYAMNASGMSAITSYLLDDTNYTNVTDITPDLLKCIFNPLQYIVSCMWFPFTVASLGSESIEVGWWTISGVSAAKLSNSVETRNLSFTLPTHPQAATRGNYLNLAPYSRYQVYAGPWGVIPIDNAYIVGKTALNFIMKIDLFTGSGRLSMSGGELTYAEDHVAQIGVPIQLGQNVLNQGALMSTINGALDVGASAVKGDVAGLLGGAVNTVANAAALTQSVPSIVGSNGSMAFNTQFRLLAKFSTIADEDNASIGRPLLEKRQISGLAGYNQCIDADPQIPCNSSEHDTIVSYMNSGFYYE